MQSKALGIRLRCWGRSIPTPQRCTATWECLLQPGQARGGAEGAEQGAGDQAEGAGARAFPLRNVVQQLGGLYLGQGKLEEALRYSRKALQMECKAFGDVHPATADSKCIIGSVLAATGKASEARAMFAEVAAVRRLVLGPDHPLTKVAESGAR